MTREIKFRAWNHQTGEMIIPKVITSLYDMELELMQYIGLKDINGKEIYEGDLCEVEFLSYAHKTPNIVSGKISWCKDDACFELKFPGDSWATEVSDKMKIIGNIYENPELLEVKND